MSSTLLNAPQRAPRTRNGTDAQEVLVRLLELCNEMPAGSQVPRHTELMERFDASERAVLWALAQLQQQGVVARRPGAGTIVLSQELGINALHSVNDNGFKGNTSELALQNEAAFTNRTIIALARPDQGVFDYALNLLSASTEAKRLFLQCHVVSRTAVETNQIPPTPVSPLGYIVFRSDLWPLAQKLQAEGNHVVLVGAPFNESHVGIPNVYGNHEQGGFRATKHLLELGHRRIAFFCNPSSLETARWKGHNRAIDEAERIHGITMTRDFFFLEDLLKWRSDPSLCRAYFDCPDAPTGVIAWNDGMALDLLAMFNAVGLRVPDDVSLVGYDNLPQSGNAFPALTTLDTNLEYQLEAALDLLTAPSRPQTAPVVITLPTLVRRDSSASPRAEG